MQRYLDVNATCPPVEAAIQAAADAARRAPGNPSSLHWAGRAARRIVDDARDALAEHLDAEAGNIVFTSGGTEANNLAIHSATVNAEPGRVVTTAIEHPAVLKPLERLAGQGWDVVQVRPGDDGVVPAERMIEHIDGETRLVCMMLANNESGALQPVNAVARHCRSLGVPMLVDAVQGLGKHRFSFRGLDVDFLSLSAHKIGGLKGVGALLVRRGVKVVELAPGGGQERGRRSGTENVPGIAGFAAALGVIDFEQYRPIRDAFERQLQEAMPEARVVAAQAERVPNTSLVLLPGLDGETLLMQLDLAGFAVASGSACSSGKREASHVLLAMGLNEQQARGSIRVSFGPGTDLEDAEALVAELKRVRERLRGMAGLAA